MTVIAHDPMPGAEASAREFVTNAWPALRELGITTDDHPPLDALRFVATPGEAAREADLVQENIPERPELKDRVLRELDAAATPEKIILSSTGGIPPSLLQASCAHPARFVVVHPFNPSHLIPLVEVVGGKQTDPAVVDWAIAFARRLRKQPIRLGVEASGHMTNRLQFALVREAVACLVEGIATAEDIDMAVRYGLGPRWTLMGSLLTLHLAGGPSGMRGILEHAGAAIEQWWTPKADLRLTDEVKEKLVRAANEVSQQAPVADWVRWRDANLVSVLKMQQASEAKEPHRGWGDIS
jgi:carnitine 3-dehydrogenase